MLTGKQRSALKKLAHDITPTVFIGKSGLTENIKRELVNDANFATIERNL